MESRHTFGESVKVNLKDGGIIYNGKVVNIKFTESKVFYDLDVLVWSAAPGEKDLHTRIYNIDSAFVESTEGYETGEYITHALNKPGGNVEFTDNNNQSNPSVTVEGNVEKAEMLMKEQAAGNEAIDFAEWMAKEGFSSNGADTWESWDYPDQVDTVSLYDIYKQSKNGTI